MKGKPIRKNSPDSKFGLFIIVSIIFHLGFLISAMLGSSRSARADLSMLNPMFVQLYQPQDFPAFDQAAGPKPEDGTVQAQPSEKNPAPAPTPAPAQKAPEKAVLPKDATKEELKKDTGSTVSNQLTDEDKKRVSDAISAIKREVNKGEASGAEAEWRDVVGGINADIEKRAYFSRASEVYTRSWVVPSSVPQDPSLRVRVIIRIGSAGEVIDYQVLSWSGNQSLDRSVQKVLELVKELPAPPLLGAQWLSIGIEFRPYQEE